jgi:hypothetical protein
MRQRRGGRLVVVVIVVLLIEVVQYSIAWVGVLRSARVATLERNEMDACRRLKGGDDGLGWQRGHRLLWGEYNIWP